MAVQYCNYDIKGTLTTSGDATIGGALNVTEYIFRTGQGSNYHRFLSSRQIFVVGNATSIDLNNGVSTFGATGSNTTLQGASVTLDASADISLDAGGSDINLKADGTNFGRFTKSGDNFHITATRQDGDIKFFGNDGGTSITALTLDMSAGGNATFAGDLFISGGDIFNTTGNFVIQNNAGAQFDIKSRQGVRFYIDSNNDDTTYKFEILANTDTYDSTKVVSSVDQSGNATFAGNIIMANAKILYTDDIRASSGAMAVGPTGNSPLTLRSNGTTRLTIGSAGLATFSSTPIVLTRSAGDNTTYAASTAFVTAAVAAVPIGNYLPLAGGTMSGNIAMGDNDITGIDQLIFQEGSYFDDVGSANYIRLKYNSTTGGGLRVEDNQGHIGGYLYSDGNTTSSFGLLDGSGSWAVRCLEDSYVELRYDNSSKLQTKTDGIFINGKLGIGTSNPDADGYQFAEDLVIKGGASASDGVGITLAGNGKRYGIIAFGDAADVNAGEIFYDHNVNAMYFRTNGSSNVVFINSAGKVTAGAATGSSDGSSTLTTKGYVDAQISSIPSGLNFQGNWNANTNSPTLASGTGTPGFYYNVSVAGTTDLDGETDWQIGDWAVFVENGTNDFWEKIDNTSTLTGVGANTQVSLWGGTNTLEGSTALTFTGGNLNVTGDGNSAQWAEAYNNQITAISDSGSSTITLTLTQEDGGTLTTSFSNPQGTVTGTGGDNRLALWNGTTAIDSNENLSISGNDLAIGTQAGTTAARLLLYGTTANNGASVIKTTNGNLHMDSDDGHSVYFNYYTGGTTSVVIGNGNVGSSGTVFYASGNATVGSNLDITTISNATSDTDKFLVADGARVKYRTGAQVLSDIGGAPATGGNYLPLAGGTMTGDVRFNDGVEIEVGTSRDLVINHDGSDSYIKQLGTGNLYIRQSVDDGDIIFQSDNGGGGVATYFKLDGNIAKTVFSRDAQFSDNAKALFGNSNDLQIYHDASNSYIGNHGTGDLYIQQHTDDGDIGFQCDNGSGGITTYFRLDGGSVTNQFLKTVKLYDAAQLWIGDDNDLQIYHDGSNSYINDVGTGDLYIQASDNMYFQTYGSGKRWITLNENASVDLFYNDSLKLATTNTGVSVTGEVVSGSSLVSKSTSTGSIIRTTTDVEPYLAFQRNSGSNGVGVIRLLDGGDLTFDTGTTGAGQSTRLTIDGATGNATFAGGITASGDLILDDGSGASPSLILKNASDETWEIRNGAAGILNFFEGSDLRLALAQGGDATFSGAIGVGGVAPSGGYAVDITPSAGNILRSTRGTSVLGSYQSTNGPAYFGTISNDDFVLITNDAARLTINSSGNATFAGTVKTTQIEIESTIPSILFDETDVTANWRNRVSSGSYRVQYATDGTTFTDHFVLGASANTVLKDTTFIGDITVSGGDITLSGDALFTTNNSALEVQGSDSLLVKVKAGNTVMTFDGGNIKTVANQNFEFDAGLIDVNGSTGSAGQLLSSTGTTVDWIDAPSGGGANGTTAEGTGSNANYFSKLATFTIASSSSFADLRAAFTIIGEETSNSAYAEISIMMRKGASSATSLDAINIAVLNNVTNGDIDSQISSDNFYLKYTSGATMAVDLYMKKNNTFGQFDIIETASNFDDWVTTYYTNSAWISALPSTTYTIQTKVTSGTFITGSPNLRHEYFPSGPFNPSPAPVAPFPNWFPMNINGPGNVVEKTSTAPNNFDNWQFQMPTDGVLQQITITNITRSFTNMRFRIFDQGTAGTTYPGTEIFTGTTFSAAQNVMAIVPVNEIMEGGRVYAMSLDLNSNATPNKFRVACLFAN